MKTNYIDKKERKNDLNEAKAIFEDNSEKKLKFSVENEENYSSDEKSIRLDIDEYFDTITIEDKFKERLEGNKIDFCSNVDHQKEKKRELKTFNLLNEIEKIDIKINAKEIGNSNELKSLITNQSIIFNPLSKLKNIKEKVLEPYLIMDDKSSFKSEIKNFNNFTLIKNYIESKFLLKKILIWMKIKMKKMKL